MYSEKLNIYLNFKSFFNQFLDQINFRIDDLYKIYNQKRKSFPVNSDHQKRLHMSFPKINSRLTSSFFRVFMVIAELNCFEDLSDSQYLENIKRLLEMTRGKSGLVEGVRNSFISQIKILIFNSEQSNPRKVQYGLNNQRLMKNFTLSLSKLEKDPLQALKKIVSGY